MKKRPVGLTVFAVINFVFSGLTLMGLLVSLSSPDLRQAAGVALSAYSIMSPLLTAGLLAISGVGFLRLSYRAGFLAGVAVCVLSLGNILVFNTLQGFAGFGAHVPSMVYPVVLLLMLTLKYRHAFLPVEVAVTEQGS
jgi:hypothetical protein